jgi:hypothetical protein
MVQFLEWRQDTHQGARVLLLLHVLSGPAAACTIHPLLCGCNLVCVVRS